MAIKICIDPGHQQHPDFEKEPIYPGATITKAKCSPGTLGIISGIYEYQLVLKISLMLKAKLEQNMYFVVMTRERNDVNISNIERAELTNRIKPDLCLKIHCNGVRKSLRYIAFYKRGLMTLTPSSKRMSQTIYERSRLIAKIIHNRLLRASGFPNRGIIERSDLTGFNWSKVPVVLLELGYLTNPIEDFLLNRESFQIKIVTSISEGIKEVTDVIKFS